MAAPLGAIANTSGMGAPRTPNLSTIGFSAGAATLIEIASARSASFLVAVWNTPHMVLVCWFCSVQKKINKYLLSFAAFSMAPAPGLGATAAVPEAGGAAWAARPPTNAATRATDANMADNRTISLIFLDISCSPWLGLTVCDELKDPFIADMRIGVYKQS